jgi:ATP-dependent Clp protease ATP-binding subunit ClpC
MDANFSVKVKDVITYSKEEALRLGHDYIGVEHLLLGIIREGNGLAIKILKSLGVDAKELRTKLEEATKTGEASTNYMANIPLIKQAEKVLKITYLEAKMFKNNVIGTEPKSKTPVLDNFGRDLTKMAEDGKLDPIVGREKEIERVSQILSRRKKNNPILIGEPGVGKSAVAEGLALRIVQKKYREYCLINVLLH